MQNKQENPNPSTPASTTSLTSEQLAQLGRNGEPISEQEYRKFVGDLAAKPEDAIARISPLSINLLHAAIGLASEAGEILDEVKKHIFYGAKLDLDAIHKEQGDMEWYAQLLRNTLGPDRSMVINSNVSKLKKRHPNGFSTESALAKADAVEDKINAELAIEADKASKDQQDLESFRIRSRPPE
jgi:NTP pyrophosphatase (non-canonical NTP hydrolase)